MFRGLFIGVDRYADKSINWLSCAEKDASSLCALFSDNLGGDNQLLIGQDATKKNIEENLSKLCNCSEDDIVFIVYSGHGSETHEIVTYDADPNALAETSITLQSLTEWFTKIPSKQIVFVLDCCFSGEMGSKVFHVDAKPKSMESEEPLIESLAGEGRIIITASSSKEPAWETEKTGHGILTDNFIKALLGPKEIVEDGQISFLRLIDYVIDRVTISVKSIGKEQTPTFKGRMDKAIKWPIFRRGDAYFEIFPEYKIPKVTANLKSLLDYGFDNGILKSWAVHIPSLNLLQIDSINDYGILKGEHLVVSAPTSSGKTMIGELASLKAIQNKKRALFLLPMKALVNDKSDYFDDLYGKYGLKIIQATGDSHDQVPNIIKGQYDICLMTYEKFASLVLTYPHILEQVGTIVIDEVQMIADKSRGANLEFILTFINSRKKYGVEPQLIALSAVIGNTNGLERWLDARLLRRDERPVPLDEGMINFAGTFKYVKSEDKSEYTEENYITRIHKKRSSQDWIIPLVQKLVLEGKQVIVFRESKGFVKGTANYLSENLGLESAKDVLVELPDGDPSIISQALKKTLTGGVAFHTADLEKDERKIIEKSFREKDSAIRVIVATTTLAMGVNTPAEAVVISGLDHPGPKPIPYSTAEYKNMVGRAGRLGKSERGFSFLLAIKPREESDYWNEYILNKPENIESVFMNAESDIESTIIKIFVIARGVNHKNLINISAIDIVDFLMSSFGAFQEKMKNATWKLEESHILQSLENLKKYNLVIEDEKGRYQITKIGWLAGQGVIKVESLIRLIEAINDLRPEQINDPTLMALAQLSIELSQSNVYFPLNSRGARKELSSWTEELLKQGVPRSVIDRMIYHFEDDYHAASQVKKAVACLLWVSSVKMSEIENILLRHDGFRKSQGVAGSIRGASNRTKDIIKIVTRATELIHPAIELSERGENLFNRLETGTHGSMNEISKELGNKLSRADYHMLADKELNCFVSIDSINEGVLLECVSGNQVKLEYIKEGSEKFKLKIDDDISNIPLIPEYEE